MKEKNDFLKTITIFIITGFVGFLVTFYFDSVIQFETSIYRLILGFMIGGISGNTIRTFAHRKVLSIKQFFSSSHWFKKSKVYAVLSGIVLSCLTGTIWIIYVAVSLHFKGTINEYDYFLSIIPILAIITTGISPFLIHHNHEKMGVIFIISNFIAMFTGFLGIFFSDMGIIDASMTEALVYGAVIGGIIPAVGATLASFSNRIVKSLGSAILGGTLFGVLGLMYSVQRYIGPQYSLDPYIFNAPELFGIFFIGIILGIFLGGILGYLDFNLCPVRLKHPIIFIILSGLIISSVGFAFGIIYHIVNIEYIVNFQTEAYKIKGLQKMGVLWLMGLWQSVGSIGGIATILLDSRASS